MIRRLLICVVALFGFSAAAQADPPVVSKPIDFNNDVRPILSGKCFQCHGPDDKVRKGKLRLDVRHGALKVIAPGQAAKSAMIARITADDDEVMPPAKSGKRLTPQEVATLSRWIEQGAPYAQHWAYAKPVRPRLQEVSDKQWPITPVDHFLLARLDKEGLKPTPTADRYALARRLSLDLTGLPPTIAEVDAFVNDKSPGAYEKLVDRLLGTPAYGERWAAVWLDLARYADSQGFANDPDRTIWRYRDWVIRSLNDNLPFDRFTVEQLAGDLLPNPSLDQLVATGFHRNTLTNTEGGTSAEEFRSAAIVDRVNTTMQVWLGTTFGCAQCHNHKYDPFSQKEFYQFYAIFNNTEDANAGNDAPTIPVPAIGQEHLVPALTAKLDAAKAKLDVEMKKVAAGLAEWEKTVDRKTLPKDVADILAQPAGKRDKKQQDRLTAYHHSLSPTWKTFDQEVKTLTVELKPLSTLTPVLREGKPRATTIHIRGNYLDKGEAVTPGLPSAFPAPPSGAPLNRLTLARWLVDANHPLTARVAVNRLWEELFGLGIVETSEDFGIQGDPPFHPELLDWLATEYIRLGWDTKKLLKLLVMSAAYRQGSQVSEEMAKRDPFNRLLARGPRLRLSAESVRDQALFAGGLLSPKMYGPPVQPPRPSFGLSAAFGGSTDWQTSAGEDRHRRAVYTKVRRNSPYPAMTTFDAPERTYCNIRRIRTNTPLQALVTLNDPVYVEASQALARRIVAEGGTTSQSRILFTFRVCVSRPPTEAEMQRLTELFEKVRLKYAAEPAKALAIATKPLGAAPQGANIADLAAWTVVANVLLNLDETLAKR